MIGHHHWKELLPVDRYVVKCTSSLIHEFDRKVLTLLYQPLIGPRTLNLYMTLWSELEQNRLWGTESTHHFLMAVTQSPLNEIYHDRLKLEGIGLLKTYLVDESEPKKYIYELQRPLSPKQFFYDGMLNIYLYNRVGKTVYQRLKSYFSDKSVDSNAKDVTRSFHEVYQSIHPSELSANIAMEPEENDQELFDHAPGEPISIQNQSFDFQLFYAGLSEHIVPKKAITPAVKEAVEKLAYVYGIDPIEMKNLVIRSLDQDEQINLDELRKWARDWYKLNHGNRLPELVDRLQPLNQRVKDEEIEQSKDKELIRQLESISPRQFLKDISGGIEPSAADLKIIEDVMFQQKLLPGVVNVLIYYVLLKTNMKLSRAYVEKIASHWARLGIKTVKDAVDVAKKEHKKYLTWAETKDKKTDSKKIVRKEKLPSWLLENENQQVENIDPEAFEKEKQKLQERIKKYKNKQKD